MRWINCRFTFADRKKAAEEIIFEIDISLAAVIPKQLLDYHKKAIKALSRLA